MLEGDVADAVGKLKKDVDGDVLVAGSVVLGQTLLEHELVDGLRLMVFPVVLGTGKRLFGNTGAETRLRQVESRAAGETQLLVYRLANET